MTLALLQENAQLRQVRSPVMDIAGYMYLFAGRWEAREKLKSSNNSRNAFQVIILLYRAYNTVSQWSSCYQPSMERLLHEEQSILERVR